MTMDELTDTLARIEDGDTNRAMSSYIPIPGPTPLPLIGNTADIDLEFPLRSLEQFADIYGPIYKLTIAGVEKLVVSSAALLEELCDEKRFRKSVEESALEQVRYGITDGLFTAYHKEHNWEIAHRILVPAFGPLSIRGMFDEMHDIGSQLVLKWARYGPEHRIHVTDDFTRLTLDTIALCAMDYRFNSYYSTEMHPFVDAMTGFLIESGKRANRPHFMTSLMKGSRQKYEADVKLLKDIAGSLVKKRRDHPSYKKDLLNTMINGRDPLTGEGLSDEVIINNMITFLIAGHETTSGMLSFAFVYLLKNSAAYRAAQKEVDEVCGKDPITPDHLSKLVYIDALLKETLRMSPTAPGFSLRALESSKEDPVTLGGKYIIERNKTMLVLLAKVHRDPKVYGEDAEEFKPERMMGGKFDKLPKGAWKPFGNGMRGCIGRAFAWQEALMIMAMLLQNLNFQLDDPAYQLSMKQTLTIKPKDFYIRATLRDNIDQIALESRLKAKSGSTGGIQPDAISFQKSKVDGAAGSTKKPMSIYYGSNTGTCEALAQRLAADAVTHGFNAVTASMDSGTQNLPKGQPVVVITASFEGQPPDNAAHFVEWLSGAKGNELEGVDFAVFGCGHHDWVDTFMRIPKLVNKKLEEAGARRVADEGSADAARGEIFSDFESWQDKNFWPAIEKVYGSTEVDTEAGQLVEVEISTSTRSGNLRQDVRQALVLESKILTAPGEPIKRHLEIQLPTDQEYRAGDYLAVLPINPRGSVSRVMKRFQLPWDSAITIKSSGPTILPTNRQLSAYDVISAYVEVGQPATRKNVLALAKHTENQKIKSELEQLSGEVFSAEVSDKRISIIDLLEKYPEVELPFGEYLSMLPPMRVRQYSISSSPLNNPRTCTLTFAVLDSDALSGQGRFSGVASTYLSKLEAGDHIQVAIRPSIQQFHLPLDASVPIIMLCAGTGLAPFHGFVQERAAQISAGRQLAKALLFVGCRSPDKDALYGEEIAKWASMGAVDVRYAYSRESEKSEGCKYVQDRLLHDKKDVIEIFEQGGKVYVCGSRQVGSSVDEACRKMFYDRATELGNSKSEEEIRGWWTKARNERFATDVFT